MVVVSLQLDSLEDVINVDAQTLIGLKNSVLLLFGPPRF